MARVLMPTEREYDRVKKENSCKSIKKILCKGNSMLSPLSLMTTFCHMCGAEAVDDNSAFCNKCGSKLILTIPKINDNTFVGQTIPSNEASLPPARDIVHHSQKSMAPKPLKRRSMVLPAILFFIAFVLTFGMIFQTGILNSLSFPGSATTSQEHRIVRPTGRTLRPQVR